MPQGDRLDKFLELAALKENTPLFQLAAQRAILEAIHDLAKLIDENKAGEWPTPDERYSKWLNKLS